MARVLALDVGTSSIRARVYDERLQEVDAGAQEEHDGGYEVDAARLAESARALMAGPDVDAIAVSCFWHSLLPLDARGRPLAPLLMWSDLRSVDEADELARTLDAMAVHRRTGCPIHPSYWPAKLLWLRRRGIEAARFVSFADYLLGEHRTSVSMASGTGLLDVHRCVWDEELLEALELDTERLPELSDEPLVFGDGACSNVGVGCVTRERAALMVGTSGAYRVLFAAERAEPRPGLFLYRLDRARFVEGGALSDGGNLWEWLQRTLRMPDDAAVADRAPGAGGLTFLPLLGGERAPGWNGRVRGAIAGLTFDAEPTDLLQAALEGVAVRFAEIAERMPEVEEVVATGHGLAANPDWVQIIADVLERPMTLAPVEEASARGAAAVALERLGEQPPAPPLGRVFEPRADRADAYRELRERQRELYRDVT